MIGIVAAIIVVVGVISYFYFTKPSAETIQNLSEQNMILIQNFNYIPSELTISVGETVTWTNKDSVQHTVTSDEGGELNSPYLSTDETYSHTFNQAGENPYYCIPHPFMKGKIIVE